MQHFLVIWEMLNGHTRDMIISAESARHAQMTIRTAYPDVTRVRATLITRYSDNLPGRI